MRTRLTVHMPTESRPDGEVYFYVEDDTVFMCDPEFEDEETGGTCSYTFTTGEWDTICTFVAAQRVVS